MSRNSSTSSYFVSPRGYLTETRRRQVDDTHKDAIPGLEERYLSISAYKAAADDEVGFGKNAVVKVRVPCPSNCSRFLLRLHTITVNPRYVTPPRHSSCQT